MNINHEGCEMKIRRGFVSNSSSSSFIVVFPRIPKDEVEMKEIMFPNGEKTIQVYHDSIDTMDVARQVYSELLSFINDSFNIVSMAHLVYSELLSFINKDNLDALTKALKKLKSKSSHPYDYQEWKDNPEKTQWKCYRSVLPSLLDLIDKTNDESVIGIFTYNDKSDFERVMENGGVFDNLQHIKVDEH